MILLIDSMNGKMVLAVSVRLRKYTKSDYLLQLKGTPLGKRIANSRPRYTSPEGDTYLVEDDIGTPWLVTIGDTGLKVEAVASYQ